MSHVESSVPKRLNWSQGSERVDTVEQLDRLLDTLERDAREARPQVVELVTDSGTLAIGLGNDESVISYIPASLDPPYLASRGRRHDDELLSFVYGSEVTEFPSDQAVPLAVAREAIREFLETGALSKILEWQEV